MPKDLVCLPTYVVSYAYVLTHSLLLYVSLVSYTTQKALEF